MAKVEVLHPGDIADLFVVLSGEQPHTGARLFRNKQYQTVALERAVPGKKFTNVIQLASPKVADKLRFQYPDEFKRPASSFVEYAFVVQKGKMPFGLGDLRPDAPALFFNDKDSKEITAMLKWMRENLSEPALAIRLKYSLRVSFTDENDFVLARLRFC